MMIDFDSVFVDTAPFIYYLEKNPTFFDKAKKFFLSCIENQVQIRTSVVTVTEYLVYPYQNHDERLADAFEQFLSLMQIEVIEINIDIAKKAAMVRAHYKGIKGMDALQLSTAIVTECDIFLTNDGQLTQIQEIKCLTLDELNE